MKEETYAWLIGFTSGLLLSSIIIGLLGILT